MLHTSVTCKGWQPTITASFALLSSSSALLSLLLAVLLLSSEILCSLLLHFVFKVVSYSITCLFQSDNQMGSLGFILYFNCFYMLLFTWQTIWMNFRHTLGFINWAYTISKTWLQALQYVLCIYIQSVCVYIVSPTDLLRSSILFFTNHLKGFYLTHYWGRYHTNYRY